MKSHLRPKGFTLLELMIIIAIIAVLATLAVVGYDNYVLRARSADLILKYDAIRTGAQSRATLGASENCDDILQLLDSSNLTDDYAALGYGFLPVKGGYQPVLDMCSHADQQGQLGVEVTRRALALLERENVVTPGAVDSKQIVSFSLSLARDDAPVCKTISSAPRPACGYNPPSVATTTTAKPPTLGGDTGAHTKEDGPTMVTGDLTSPTAGATLHLGDHVIPGKFGSLDVRDQGHWIYRPNHGSPEVQGLKQGETATDVFTVQVPGGGSQPVTITITGTHDLPQITVPSPNPPEVETVAQDCQITGATDLSQFGQSQQGVALGTALTGLYRPGSSNNELATVNPADLPKIYNAYTHYQQSGYQYFDQSGLFGRLMPQLANTLQPVSPSVRNSWDGGIAVFADGTTAQLIKVANGNGTEKDYAYFKVIDGVNANGCLTRLSGTGTPGQTVTVRDGSRVVGTATPDANGKWTLASATPLTDGQHALSTIDNGVSTDPKIVTVSGSTVTDVAQTAVAGTVLRGDPARNSASGTLTVTDADRNDRPTFVAQSATPGKFGSFTIDGAGSWSYTLNPGSTSAAGATSEQFTVQVTTASGESVTKEIAVNVQ